MSTQSEAPTRPQYDFFDKSEAAASLRATVRQVERWTAEGRLGHVRLGNKTLYTPEQIRAFVASCTVDPSA